MDNFVIELISNYGYLGMFIGMVLEAVIIVIPSEVILVTGGVLASKHLFSFWLCFIVGVLGSVFCALIIYLMGYFGGYPFIKRYGKYFFMTENDLQKGDSFFNKYGMFSALVGRNIPIVRTIVSLPIGIMRLSISKFLVYTTLGTIPWTFIFIYLGYTLGNKTGIINIYLERLKFPIKICLFLLIISYFIKKMLFYMKKKSKN